MISICQLPHADPHPSIYTNKLIQITEETSTTFTKTLNRKNYQSRIQGALDQALRVPFKIRGHVAGEKRNQAQAEEHQAANPGPRDRLPLKRRRRRRCSPTRILIAFAITITIGVVVTVLVR